MGHNHFPALPTTRRWREVVELISVGGDIYEIASASARAAEKQLERAHLDPVYRSAVELLFRIPLAAREDGFGRALREIGLPVGEAPDLTDIIFAAGEWLDQAAREGSRAGDFGELSRRALLSALSNRIGAELPGLFDATAGEVARAARRFASPRDFTALVRSFYTRLVTETLSSFLDRELASHVGPGRRFANSGIRSAFDDALHDHSYETTRIIHEFTAGWHGHHVVGRPDVTSTELATFGYSALAKVLAELRRRDDG
nr:hypothetical protein [Nitrosomonas nitrosa]